MDLGADPNEKSLYSHPFHGIICYHNRDLLFIKQVLEIFLHEKKEYCHYQYKLDWDKIINKGIENEYKGDNPISKYKSDKTQDNIVTLCIKCGNLETFKYLCDKSKQFNAPIDMSNDKNTCYKTPLFYLFQSQGDYA